jgi:hypothetical protein
MSPMNVCAISLLLFIVPATFSRLSFANAKYQSGRLPVVMSAQDKAKNEKTKVKPDESKKDKEKGGQGKVNDTAVKAEILERIQEAIGILKNLDKDSDTIDDPEMRIKTKVQVADALWPYDKESAVDKLKNSFIAIDEITLSIQPTKGLEVTSASSVKQSREEPKIEQVKERLRHYVLKTISRRDVDLADSLAKSVSTKSTAFDLRLDLAANIAGIDPERASVIAKDVVKSGELNNGIMRPLLAIRRSNPDLSDAIFLDLLNQMSKNRNYYTTNTIQLLGIYVIEFEEERYAQQSLTPKKAGRKAVEQYLRFAHQVLLYQIELQFNQQNGQQLDTNQISESYWMLNRLLPLYEELIPSESQVVRQELDKLSVMLSDSSRVKLSGKTQSPQTVQDLLAQAEQPSSLDEKDWFYVRAAVMAVQQGDVEQALFIVHKIHDYEKKESVFSNVRYQAAMRAVFAKDNELAYSYAKDISSLLERSIVFKEMAGLAVTKKKIELAKKLLDEIDGYINNGHESHAEKAYSLVYIAEAYLKFDQERGFEVTEGLVKWLNAADFPNAKEQFAKTSAATKNKSGKIDRKLEHFNVEGIFFSLGRNDFARALRLAQSLNKKEVAIPATIAVCKARLM